jgi:hypothetical protein
MAHGVKRQIITDRYAIYNGDCIEVMQSLPDESFHGSIYSPPFGGLYHYSSDERDLSNARNYAEFFEHYGYVIREKFRLTMPGRTSGVHAALVPTGNTGKDAYRLPRRRHPGTPADRLWTSSPARHLEGAAGRPQPHDAEQPLAQDDRGGRQHGRGRLADELLVFRKPGAAKPVDAPDRPARRVRRRRTGAADLHRYRAWEGDQKANRYSHWIWRRYASSVWDDIRIDRVLPFRTPRTRTTRSTSTRSSST